MSISKKKRFEVFKKDGFRCAYCGKTPPAVTLEVDHIEPRSKGGTDAIVNLLTACFDCNRGKRDIPLDKAPATLIENVEILKEQEEQLKEYRKLAKKVERRIQKDIKSVREIYRAAYPGWTLEDEFCEVSLRQFIDRLPLDVVQRAMRQAVFKFPDDNTNSIKYFCGICWRTIRGEKPWEGRR